jgi:hypothetical protein
MKERGHFDYLDVEEDNIKMDFKKLDARAWAGLMRLRIRTSGRPF